MSIEIVIDPNVRVAGNRTYGGFEDVIGGFVDDLKPGDHVTVLEEESDVVGDAVVYEVNPVKQLVYLTVDWSSLKHRARDVSPQVAAALATLVRVFEGPGRAPTFATSAAATQLAATA